MTEVNNRKISKPAVLGAPYDFGSKGSTEPQIVEEAGISGLTAYKNFTEAVQELPEDHPLVQAAHEALTSTTIEHQEEEGEEVTEEELAIHAIAQIALLSNQNLEILKGNLAKMFRQMGHEQEWNKIINS